MFCFTNSTNQLTKLHLRKTNPKESLQLAYDYFFYTLYLTPRPLSVRFIMPRSYKERIKFLND
jgi:hypothetical protein